ncbi:uncharacterized protein F54H12.2, partial [Trichonephila clavata]
NNKVKIHIPDTSTVNLQDGLRDLLGFKKSTLHGGTHISDYPLELDGGITEIYVYSDIIESHFLGDTIAPLLRIIPVMSTKRRPNSAKLPKTAVFSSTQNYIDCIEIELKSNSGDERNPTKKIIRIVSSEIERDEKKQTYSRSNMDSRACACVKSELDLFNVNPVQLSTEDSSFTEIFPVASLSDKTPIEFYVSSQANYSYRCIFDALLSPRVVQESMLTSGLFYKDAASKHESVELANGSDNIKPGYQTRYNICKDSNL